VWSTLHPGPQRELVENPHELVSRQQRFAAFDDAHRVQMREVAPQPLRLRIHDLREFAGDPWELAGVSHNHAEKSVVFRGRVEIENCPSSEDLRHIAGFQKGGFGSSLIEIMRRACCCKRRFAIVWRLILSRSRRMVSARPK
jgi:hypothetical protein